ncbi:ClpXP adapter SpxH family protein [Aciduricibacillus chroicocephali]|uniref:ClpXP adapter protein SpxH n=1 Tax=Aciduricibacillus chroicocephali TaxID=3054939 RepID=A0ABY9KXR0_9BACI|nr:ClpXP adapter SpxH family protein [Bacillaceae bacterium 44XB]
MSRKRNRFESCGPVQTTHSDSCQYFDFFQKPVEIFVFIDPLCAECWSLDPILKKLTMQYGRFFTIQPIISSKLDSLNLEAQKKPEDLKRDWERTAKRTGMSCDGDLWVENPISSPWVASLAIKAAGLQGKRAGRIFLRRLQEAAFLYKQNVSDESVIVECAEEVGLDIEEFKDDLYSVSARKALQCDLKLTREMDVDTFPSLVFFNQADDNEDGIKISGLHSYHIYVLVLKEILQRNPLPSANLPLEEFLSFYKIVGTYEIAFVYDWTLEKAEREMMKLQLRRKVRKIPAKHGNFWKYIK